MRPRGYVPGASIHAAASTVPVETGIQRVGVAWGVGGVRLAPVEWAPPVEVYGRDAAMSIPSLSRARDLLCGAVAGLPLTLWTAPVTTSEQTAQLSAPAWMVRPDPLRPRYWILAWTADDLFFYGRAYWRVTARYEDSYPSAFRLMPVVDTHIDTNGKVTFKGQPVPPADVIEFLSGNDGVLAKGWRTIQRCLNLDTAAERFSTSEIPMGWLQQKDNSEPLTSDELTSFAQGWGAARSTRAVGALNSWMEYHESSMDPSRLQLLEARQHEATEISRLTDIPAYFLNAAVQGMTYMNAAQAKQDLVDFGAAPLIAAIEQTLSGPNVTPRTQAVRLDMDAWLRNPYTPGEGGPGRPRQVDGLNEGNPA